MSLKNERLTARLSSLPSVSHQRQPRSLRLRLVLWYGSLLTIALVFFGVLVWELTTNALNQSVDSSVQAEARVADLALSREILPTSPYWPAQLSLHSLNTYQESGIAVEVIDVQGSIRYDSDRNSTTHIPFDTDTAHAILAGQTSWYTANVDGVRVRVEALPVRAPVASSNKETTSTTNTGPVIGTLLVAKSLTEVNATLLLLRTLLLLVGIATLAGALLGGWAIAARVLSPLAEMVKTARAIAAMTAQGTRIGNLSQRVRRPGGRDEMAQVVDTFNEMLTNLERATRTQRRFIADASHELRAPLTTIQGNLAFLRHHIDELSPEERHTMLADAHAETLRLAQLVEELLLLARADANVDTPPPLSEKETTQGERERQPVELDRTVLQLVRQFRGRLHTEEVKLEVGHIEPLRVRGDDESIRRVLLILLDNALKYTPENERNEAGPVVVSLERIQNEAVLRVRDTGIGIEPDDLPHIFERFYRADRARSRQGTGLGLSIAWTIVEQLGGRITAESTPGHGSTFSVWLPLAV